MAMSDERPNGTQEPTPRTEHELFVPPARVPAAHRLAAHAFLAGDEIAESLRPALDAAVLDLEPTIQDLVDLARRRGPESRAWDNVRRLLASRIAHRLG
jgi:hypothetical protein